MQGTEYTDVDGKKIVKDPKVEFREPTDPKAAINATMAHYSIILAETRQEHVLTNTEALMSGKSREQARAGFEASVRPTKIQCEYLAANVMEVALAMAEAFVAQPGLYTRELRVVTTCRVDTGPSAASEREQDNLAVKDHIMAVETAMERAGVVDVDAEMARIAASPRYELDILIKQLEALKAASEAGVPPEAIAEIMGMDAKLIGAIKKLREEEAENAIKEIEAKAPAPAPARPNKVA
jgi:hypothetical protein